jgi:rubrerythrin
MRICVASLAAEFDTIIADESNHRDELRLMLARWP